MYNPVYFQDENGMLYYLKDGIYTLLQFKPTVVAGGGGRGARGLQGIQGPAGPSGASNLLEVKVSLTANEIQNLNTTKKLAIPNPGVGKMIDVIDCVVAYSQGTIQFNGDDGSGRFFLELISASATDYYYYDSAAISLAGGIYALSTNYKIKLTQLAGGAGGIFPSAGQIFENENLFIKASADSTTGNGTADVYISYIIITV